jgi:hypothetical protein
MRTITSDERLWAITMLGELLHEERDYTASMEQGHGRAMQIAIDVLSEGCDERDVKEAFADGSWLVRSVEETFKRAGVDTV